jgi:glycosyltransferase involved in cell wall biosynthesis
MIEQLHYLGNVWEWKKVARRFSILQVVSGSNHAGLAFALSNRKFVCWAATPYEEDRKARRSHWTLLRRLVDKCLISPVQGGIEAYIYRKCSQIIALSNYTADTISRRFGIPREHIIVLPCLIDTELLFPPAVPYKGKNVLFVARYNDERKNTTMLIRAFARLLEHIPDARLLLVGDEPDIRLLDFISKVGIRDAVEFKGPVSNSQVINYYHHAAVFAIPSWQEGLGIVGLEAMACGLPVVSTRCGGPEDFVRDGATGFLVPLNDYETMANRLIELLNNPLLRSQMGKQARGDVEERFSYKVLGKIFDKVYRQVYLELFKSNMIELELSGEIYADQSGN